LFTENIRNTFKSFENDPKCLYTIIITMLTALYLSAEILLMRPNSDAWGPKFFKIFLVSSVKC